MAVSVTLPGGSLPLMVGLPDDSLVPLLNDGPRLFWIVPGNTSFPSQLAPQFQQRLAQVFFGPNINLVPAPAAYGKPLVNNIGDPDTSSISLGILAKTLETTRGGCFNHPMAVIDSARDRVATKLAGLPGLQVPRTVRLRLDEPADLLEAAARLGLGFPLIVRLTGAHNGSTTVRIGHADELKPALRQIAWGGHDLYVTEFVDYRDVDGRYRKLRLVVVGGEYFIRHLIVADEWHVHAQKRDAAAAAEESTMLAEFPDRVLPRIREVLGAIRDTMGLDYFGIDCSLRPDGRLLLFEANAAMNILHNSAPSPNCWDTPIALIRDALTSLLFDPSRWLRPPHAVAQA